MGDARAPYEHILIIVPIPEPQEIIADFKKKHPHVKITFIQQTYEQGEFRNLQDIPDELFFDATILVTLFTLPRNLKLIPNLKLIHVISAGVDRLAETPIWKETNITITNSSGIHGPQIAEWVILQILANAHKEKTMLEWQKRHHWGSQAALGTVVDGVGQRLGVLGYGAIGRQAARIAKAMGYDVIAYTATPKDTAEKKKDRGYIVPGTGDPDGLVPSAWYSGLDKESLHNFLAQDIDVLLVSVPLTPQTTHFLSAPEFALLGKKGAFVANIARGKVLQQDDLIAALRKSREEGGLRGAALDVTDPEPLPEDSELWDLENVAVTPHVSGAGGTYAERSFGILEQNLTRMERGERLLNVVDRKKGY
ncbi:D-isomer-specific 2-hydroxyacid dehydrogenase-like protein [Coleophoma cylindrospora]|uniref:D-isomer-specific 2-hydroxyacid dehydrogenase-like protein n=1 Tax=Coleophoma cylindrospora TaxID=1849047 RepID=A0A3D8QXC4_9HELO|nr:D-isomer-specific 2-hydroxyacid dehydrogenase-like protein [Coleophoma cylindrospora]